MQRPHPCDLSAILTLAGRPGETHSDPLQHCRGTCCLQEDVQFTNREVGSKMLQGEVLGTCLQLGQAALLSSALIRDGEMLLQQTEMESRVTPGRVGW